VSVLVIVLQSPEIPEGLMNNPVLLLIIGKHLSLVDVKYSGRLLEVMLGE
jgi:hypothetical protein